MTPLFTRVHAVGIRYVIALVSAAVVAVPAVLAGGEPFRLQVSPAVSRAPAVLTVRVTVEPAAENRALEIVAESAGFFRSSQIEIDGARSARLNVFQFRNVPRGVYQVTGVLVGDHGRRTTVIRVAKVE